MTPTVITSTIQALTADARALRAGLDAAARAVRRLARAKPRPRRRGK